MEVQSARETSVFKNTTDDGQCPNDALVMNKPLSQTVRESLSSSRMKRSDIYFVRSFYGRRTRTDLCRKWIGSWTPRRPQNLVLLRFPFLISRYLHCELISALLATCEFYLLYLWGRNVTNATLLLT